MRNATAGRAVAASILALTMVGAPLPIAMAQEASPVASPVASPLAALDPAMVAGTSIPMGNDQRTGAVEGAGVVGTPKILWSTPMEGGSGWLPATGDGIVVSQTGSDLVVLDRASGAVLWSVPWAPSSGDPVLDGGVIYVNGVEGAAAFDAATGVQLWSFVPDLNKEANPDFPLTELDGSPLKVGDTVFVSSSTWGGVYALDATTGAPRWTFDSQGDVMGSLAELDGVIYLTSNPLMPYPEAEEGDSALRAIDAETGAELWNVSLGPDVWPFSTTSVADGMGLVNVWNGEAGQIQVQAFDLATHELVWAVPVPNAIRDAGMAVADGMVFLPAIDATGVYAYDLQTGDLVWEHMTSATASPSPAVAGGVLYVQTDAPELQAIDTATGGVYWTLPLGEPSGIGTWGVRLSDGVAYVDTGDTIVAVTGDGGAMPPVTGGSDYPPAAAVVADPSAYFGVATQLATAEPMLGAQGVGVAPNGDIYVIEAFNNRIQIFNPDGTQQRSFGEAGEGDGQFHFLFDEQGRYGGDIVFASDGTMYVSDMANSRIQVFDKDGNFLASWPLETDHMVDRPLPTGLALDEAGGRLFIGDWDSNYVLVYDLDGKKIGEWGAGGAGDETRFSNAFDIAVAPDGTIYITDANRFRIRSYTTDGDPIGVFGGFGSEPGRFIGATSVAVDANGNIFTTDYQNNRIQVFSPAGEVIGIWDGATSEVADFANPWSLTVAPDGTVYVIDENYEGGKVVKITPPGMTGAGATPVAPVASPAA